MTFESRCVCTAILTRGEITQRVDRIIRPTRDAKKMIERAELIRRKVLLVEDRRAATMKILRSPPCIATPRHRRRAPNPGRRGPTLPHTNSKSARPFRVIAISVYLDVLKQIDDAVSGLKASGHTKMTRSQLLRLAFQAFDSAQVALP